MKKYLEKKPDFETLAEFYDELPLWSAPFGLKLLDKINYNPGINILDIGFGAGFPLLEVAMRFGEDSVIYGIDPSKASIKIAERKINHYGISNIRIIEGMAESIPLESASLDLIISNNGINNVNDIDKVLSECSRLIKKNGQFLLTMNLKLSMFEFYMEFEKTLRTMNMNDEILLLKQHILKKRKPLDEVISLLDKHGFIIKNLENDQFNYRFVNATAMLNHRFIKIAFMDSWIEILPKEKAEYIFDNIESSLNEISRKTNGLSLSIPFVVINAIKR